MTFQQTIISDAYSTNLDTSHIMYKTYVVGSSKSMTGGLFISSRATERRFLSPPDS
jgi:hypothetical protein